MYLGEVELAHAAYQAAKENLQDDIDRPILNLKLDNVAPYNGTYVGFESDLAQALTEAQESLAQDAEDTVEAESKEGGALEAESEPVNESEQSEVEQTTD